MGGECIEITIIDSLFGLWEHVLRHSSAEGKICESCNVAQMRLSTGIKYMVFGIIGLCTNLR